MAQHMKKEKKYSFKKGIIAVHFGEKSKFPFTHFGRSMANSLYKFQLLSFAKWPLLSERTAAMENDGIAAI